MKKLVSILLTLAMMATMISATLALPSDLKIQEGQVKAPGEMGNAVTNILGAIQWVGYAFAVGMLIYIGIKYVMSAANEKADLKKGAINYVIGAIIIAGASTICGWIVKFGNKDMLSGGTTTN